MDRVTVVIPCYNEEQVVDLYMSAMLKIEKEEPDIAFDYIFVDDGSSDRTLDKLKELSSGRENIGYISFTRNFGKEAAILAGLEHAGGDYVVLMDVDLQDPPSFVPEMYRQIKTGRFDCVATRRVTRQGEPPIRSFFARMFYKLINRISDLNITDGARDFRMMTRQYVGSILKIREYNRFSKGIFSWVGFNTKWLEYENVERAAGETKWSFWKLFKYFIEGVTAFSTVPLMLSSFAGILCFFSAIFIALLYAVKAIIYGDPVAGFPTLICFILIIGGANFLFLGILGQYVSKMYLETKHRPVYLIKSQHTAGGQYSLQAPGGRAASGDSSR